MHKIEHLNKQINTKTIPIIKILSIKDFRMTIIQNFKKETITVFIKTTWAMGTIDSASTWRSKASLHNLLRIILSEMLRVLQPRHFMLRSSNRAILSASSA